MKPYVLVAGDFTPWGGMDRANLALAEELARRGHEVSLVTHRFATHEPNSQMPRVHRVKRLAGSHLLGAPLLRRAGLRHAAQVARRGGRVVVNGGNCPWGDANWVHYVHKGHEQRGGGPPLRRWARHWKHRADARDERVALARARCVIANSERTRRECIDTLGVPSDRVRTIYYGVDAALFRPATELERAVARAEFAWPHHRRVVLFIGALGDRRKGFDTLLTAWERARIPAERGLLAVVGAGSELPRWKAEVRRRALSDRVEFLGFRTDVPRLMRAADMLVSPTRYEAYGLGVHEALCCGIPALVSADAGVAERYPNTLRSLLLHEPENAEGLASALADTIALDTTRRRAVDELGAHLRARCWSAMASDVIAWVESTNSGREFRP